VGDGLGSVPAFHLMSFTTFATEQERREELRWLDNSRQCLKMLEVDPSQSRFVLSGRRRPPPPNGTRSVLRIAHHACAAWPARILESSSEPGRAKGVEVHKRVLFA
jgi:hypothetical protein